MVVCIIPRMMTSSYGKLKELLTKERPIPSQFVFTHNCNKPLSVYNKIALQINAKMGGTLWFAQLPQEMPSNSIVIGMDVFHDTRKGSRSVLGICSTIDSNLTKYYNQVAFHKPRQEIADTLGELCIKSFKAYYRQCGRKPDNIFIFRDGVGDSQFKTVADYEFPQIIRKIQEFDRAWSPKFTIVVVNKRVNTRFFAGTGNPQPGTLINKDVVGKHYNFYLLSHAAGRGTATPTHYNVVYDNSGLPSNLLENLTYRLCFNYYNWNGAIKVPAPCQNAHKLAYLVGKYTQVDFSEKIAKNYFYL